MSTVRSGPAIWRELLICVDGLCFSPTFCVGTFLKTLRLCRASEGQIKRLRVLSLDKKVLTLHIASQKKLVFLRCVYGTVPEPVQWAKQQLGLTHIL